MDEASPERQSLFLRHPSDPTRSYHGAQRANIQLPSNQNNPKSSQAMIFFFGKAVRRGGVGTCAQIYINIYKYIKYQIEQHINPRFPRFSSSSQSWDRSGEERRRRGWMMVRSWGWKKIHTTGEERERERGRERERDEDVPCAVAALNAKTSALQKKRRKKEKRVIYFNKSVRLMKNIWSSSTDEQPCWNPSQVIQLVRTFYLKSAL